MQIIGKAKRVSIYIGEGDRWGRKSLHLAILEMLKQENCAGATVIRGLAGFGAHSKIRTTSLVALSSELPLVVEWVDNPARVERLMPKLLEMVSEGLVTVQDVDVTFYSHRELRHLSAFVPVQDIMTTQPLSTSAATPLAEVVKLLLEKAQKSLPVVDDDGHVIGILTDGDLLKKTDLLNLSVNRLLSKGEIELELQRLRNTRQSVGDVMTPDPITLTSDTTIPEAVEIMLARDIKRLPIVDADNHLIGIVSRVDVLRAFAQPLTVEAPRQSPLPGQHLKVADVMTKSVPTVRAFAPLSEIVSLLVSSVQRRVVVLDADDRVVGIVTDGDLIKRVPTQERTSIIQSLTGRLAPGPPTDLELGRRTAAQVMTQPVITVASDVPLVDALQLLLEHGIKRLPVVDGQGRLVGLVGRAGILQALGQS